MINQPMSSDSDPASANIPEDSRQRQDNALPVFDLDTMLASITAANIPDFQPFAQQLGAEIIVW